MESTNTLYDMDDALQNEMINKIARLDQEMIEINEGYRKVIRKLTEYEGKVIEDNISEMAPLIFELRQRYCHLYPILYFITTKNDHAERIKEHFNVLMKDFTEMGLWPLEENEDNSGTK